MSWRGPRLEEDQRDLVQVVDGLAGDHEIDLDDAAPEVVSKVVASLAELGLWTLGTEESHGGGGADAVTTALVLERLGRHWPALGWASAQAHAAVDVLGRAAASPDLVQALHAGSAGVAVVDAASAHVHLTWVDDVLIGTVDRVDAAFGQPHLLVLHSDSALLVAPETFVDAEPVRTTGLGGALTSGLTVRAPRDSVLEIPDADVAAARVRLRLGAAAVAAGIADAAADDALSYASGRIQFGGALTALPTVRQSLLGQAAQVAVSLRTVLATATDEVEAWAVQRHACEAAIDVAASALQSHGGYGYLAEYPVERRLRDAVSLRAASDAPGGAEPSARSLVGSAPSHI